MKKRYVKVFGINKILDSINEEIEAWVKHNNVLIISISTASSFGGRDYVVVLYEIWVEA